MGMALTPDERITLQGFTYRFLFVSAVEVLSLGVTAT